MRSTSDIDLINKVDQGVLSIGKAKLKKMIEKTIYEQGLSYHKISKTFGFSRSKLNDFFKYEKYNVFSVKKLIEINKKLNQKYN